MSMPFHRAPLLAAAALCAMPVSAATFERISVTTIAAPLGSTGVSTVAAATPDGRYAVLRSSATNLVPGDVNGVADLFRYDATDGSIERVSLGDGRREANAPPRGGAAISADGRYVFFASAATGLVAAAVPPGSQQLYRHDRDSGSTVLLSRDSGGNAWPSGAILLDGSADARYLLLRTRDALVAADSNSFEDIYRLDTVDGSVQLVSAATNGSVGDSNSGDGRLSGNGRYVVFESNASNFAGGHVSWNGDIFWRDLDTGVTQLASRTVDGLPYTGFASIFLGPGGAVSDSGRYVVFNTTAPLDPADSNNSYDGYRFDASNGSVARITFAVGGGQIEYGAHVTAFAVDASSVVMQSYGVVLTPSQPSGTIRSYWRELAGGSVEPLRIRAGNEVLGDYVHDCQCSSDLAVAYCGSISNYLVDGDNNGFADAFRVQRGVDGGVRVSLPLASPVAAADHDSGELSASASADGRYVVFDSLAGNLVVGDFNMARDIFLRDRLAGTTIRISARPDGGELYCSSQHAQITPDGRYIVFDSCGAPVPPTIDGYTQVYRHDRLTGETQLMTIDGDGKPGNSSSYRPQISDDGSVVLFYSFASNLGSAANPTGDYYLRDVATGGISIVSRNPLTGTSDGYSFDGRLSGDGRYVAFGDTATNLVDGDSNNNADVFVFDRIAQQLERVSVDGAGQQLIGFSFGSGISADGRHVLFRSSSMPIGGSTVDGWFVRDRISGTVSLVSTDASGQPLAGWFSGGALSADGRRVALTFSSDDGVVPVGFAAPGLYLYDRDEQRLRRLTPAGFGEEIYPVAFSASGEQLAFSTRSANLAGFDGNGRFTDVFLAGNLDDTLFANGFDAMP